jgi:hypothetical protein
VTEQLEARDLEYVRLLKIFHFVWGVFCCFFGLIGLAYGYLGTAVLRTFERHPGNENPPMLFATISIVFSVAGFIVFETCGVLSLFAAGKYRKPHNYRFCFLVSILNCFLLPVGTALGVFAIFVLNRPSVKTLFEKRLQAQR